MQLDAEDILEALTEPCPNTVRAPYDYRREHVLGGADCDLCSGGRVLNSGGKELVLMMEIYRQAQRKET